MELYLLRQHVKDEILLGEGGERSVRGGANVSPLGEPPQPLQDVLRERLNVTTRNTVGYYYNMLRKKYNIYSVSGSDIEKRTVPPKIATGALNIY